MSFQGLSLTLQMVHVTYCRTGSSEVIILVTWVVLRRVTLSYLCLWDLSVVQVQRRKCRLARGGKVKERGREEGDRIQDGRLRTLRHLTLFSSWETGTQREWVKKEGHFTKMQKLNSTIHEHTSSSFSSAVYIWNRGPCTCEEAWF